MTVAADGSAQVETRDGRARAPSSRRRAVGARRGRPTAAGARRARSPSRRRPDALSYRFTYGGKQVETDSGAMPEALEPLIGSFIRLVDRYGTK